jgi:3-dehydroquinate synthase
VVGDLAGFAAAVTLRGLDFIQVPTTLLSQVDSSVGGKTGINTRQGKNLIGAFHQPRLVLIDTETLGTLPERQLKAGYAEVVKYGLIRDTGFFEWLEAHGGGVLAGDQTAMRFAILASCRNKAEVVGADEREAGDRALLNFGHTFGHAFEALAGYDGGVLHGEAVSVGMVKALQLSHRMGLCAGQDVQRAIGHLSALGLASSVAELRGGAGWPIEDLMARMGQDKKVRHGELRLILARGIGDAFITDQVTSADLRASLADPVAA